MKEILSIKEILKSRTAKIHFVGVGGVGMYSLFRYLKRAGYTVTGSDRSEGMLVKRLISDGECVYTHHSEENARGASLVIYSNAVPQDNPELLFARKMNIPAFARARLLGAIISSYKRSIGVIGTHGKSTVTAMIYSIMKKASDSVDCICGAHLGCEKEPFSFSDSDTLIYEACEYQDSFLSFFPTYNVFLNLELDHTDYFEDITSLKTSFSKASENARFSVINRDDINLPFSKSDGETHIFAGKSEGCRYRLLDITENGGKYSFSVREVSGRVTKIALNIYGDFNVCNALMAYAVCRENGIEPERIAKALCEFEGVPRRLELIGRYKNHPVYYDYAHHPTEIRGGILAISAAKGLPIVIFRPHTFSRTRSLFDGFVSALSLAKRALILDIEGIREKDDGTLSSQMLAESIGKSAERVTENDVFNYIDKTDAPIILMGASNVEKIKERLTQE